MKDDSCTQEKTEEYRLLLLRMLAPIRRSNETPLQFEINSRSIVMASLADFCRTNLSVNKLLTALDQVVANALRDKKECFVPMRSSYSESMDLLPVMTAWLDEIFHETRKIDPLAIEILGLRLEGMDSRTISEKLETGLRLVEQIILDIQDLRATRITTGSGAC